MSEQHENQKAENMSPEQALLAGKYHSVEALEQGYRELSKQLRVRPSQPEVPESYTLPEGMADEALFGHMQEAFRNAGLSQAQVAALAEAFAGYENGLNLDPEAEKQALGKEADAIINRVSHFAQRHFQGEELAEIQALASTAAGVRALDKLARLSGEKAVPTEAASAATAEHLKAQALRMLAEPDFRHNRAKQAEYNRLWADALRG